MHGLNTIHGINAEAARLEHVALKRQLIKAGKVVAYKTDTLGLADINEKPLGFETVALAQQFLLGKGAFWRLWAA